jgi:hypothetical protein
MKNTRIVAAGMLILLMLAFTSSLVAMAGDISGDDDYDWAAGGTPELAVRALPEGSAPAVGISYSGDDDYDLAAGGAPELSLLAFTADVSLTDVCSLSADELAAQSTLAEDGGYSGDDDYDYAAGGMPDAVFC